MTHTVTKLGKSQKGRVLVFFDGKHASTDCYLLGNKCEEPPLNASIEVNTTNEPFNGRDCWWLNSWSLSANQMHTGVSNNLPSVTLPVPTAFSFPKESIPEPTLRFISNVVATAITAGLIKNPADMGPWAYKAYKLTNKKDLDEEIPY